MLAPRLCSWETASQAAESSQCHNDHKAQNKIYKVVVITPLLYRCEMWTIYRRHTKEFEIRWRDKLMNIEEGPQ